MSSWTVRGDHPCRHERAIYELPSSNEDQMEFRYKHWCGRAERGRTRAPPCRRYSGGTEYEEGRPYISAIDGPGGPIITGDHLTRTRAIVKFLIKKAPQNIISISCLALN